MSEFEFIPLSIAVLTVSDSRGESEDRSGKILVEALQAEGHSLAEKCLVADDLYQIRREVSRWIAEESVDAVMITGGTGLTGRDRTPEALIPLFDMEIEGFGEMFRAISQAEIATSALQSRALAGVANGTFIFALPGSPNACRTAWDKIIRAQLDNRTRPCNLAMLRPRLRDH